MMCTPQIVIGLSADGSGPLQELLYDKQKLLDNGVHHSLGLWDHSHIPHFLPPLHVGVVFIMSLIIAGVKLSSRLLSGMQQPLSSL